MKRIPCIILVCLAVSCSGSASADIPVWRWTDGEVQGGEAVTEPHPSIVELGWTNVTAAFTAVPEGIAVYRSPEALDGVKAVAYIAVADLQKITWDVYSIDDPAILGTTDELRTPSAWFAWKPAPVVKGRVRPAKCSNPRCITNQEIYLPHYFTGSGDTVICEYCDERTLL